MNYFLSILIFALSTLLFAQNENQLLERSFWKTKPDLEKVKERIELGDDPAALTSHKFDPLVWAILDNAPSDIIDYLLTFKRNDVNKITHDERTYIYWAAYKSNVDLMKKLIDQGAKLDLKDVYGFSVANFAASSGQSDPQIYILLHNSGVDLKNDFHKTGANPFLYLSAAISSDDEFSAFTRLGFSMKNEDKDGNNVFTYAASTCNSFMLKKAMQEGIDPNANNSQSAFMALKGTRAKRNNLEDLKNLQNIGVDFTKKDDEGNSALHMVSKRNASTEIATWLVEIGCESDSKNKVGMTPYLTAVESASVDLIKFFQTRYSNMSATNDEGNTDFHLAALRNDIEILKYLTHNTSNINAKNKEGYTPLHLVAMKAEKLELLQLMVDAGANKEIETEFGETAYDLAKENEKINGDLNNMNFLK